MSLQTEEYYRGVRMVPYDLVREGLVAFGLVLVLVVVLATLLSSPDVPPLTIRQVAEDTPVMFLQVALRALDGSGKIASYGPPYNHGSGSVQYVGPISLQAMMGVPIPVNAAQDFVVAPLRELAHYNVRLGQALAAFQAASSQRQQAWEKAYGAALAKASVDRRTLRVPAGDYGPVGPMMENLLNMGQSGALDGFLLTVSRFYQTDYTKPLLFIQGAPLSAEAQAMHLLGSQWGMMNETGSYPGQAWLWLYTFWYQIPPYSTSPNGDADVWLTMTALTLVLVLVPFIPGLNRLPRHLGLYKVIWRDYYRERRAT
jgi:hypothetical protein